MSTVGIGLATTRLEFRADATQEIVANAQQHLRGWRLCVGSGTTEHLTLDSVLREVARASKADQLTIRLAFGGFDDRPLARD